MYSVIIKTIGEVSFTGFKEQSIGYQCDVPYGSLGLPYIPLYRVLEDQGLDLKGLNIGFGQSDSFRGFVTSASTLVQTNPYYIPIILSYFTEERFDPESGQMMRSLKPGLTFNASVTGSEEAILRLRKALSNISTIGVRNGQITGEVQMELIDLPSFSEQPVSLFDKCRYFCLSYSMMLMTPACFQTPYVYGHKTKKYIPGEVIHELISRSGILDPKKPHDSLICTNAYIGNGVNRSTPLPVCCSIVKLQKDELRYRLADGKDPHRVEQDVVPSNAFTESLKGQLVRYHCPEVERIYPSESGVEDALSAGQVFTGLIYGTDEEIRSIATCFQNHPITFLGEHCESGYGEAYRTIVNVWDERIPEVRLANRFDLCLVSNTVLRSDDGTFATDPEAVLREISRKYGYGDRLRIVGSYSMVEDDYRMNSFWPKDSGTMRCIGMGSVLRIEVRGDPVDIFPIHHCFIGEHTEFGYGEVITIPARDTYYRLAEKVSPPRYRLQMRESARSISSGALLSRYVIQKMIQSRVQGLAYSDRAEFLRGISLEDLIPLDILRMFRERYDPSLTEDVMREWYESVLKEGMNEKLD